MQKLIINGCAVAALALAAGCASYDEDPVKHMVFMSREAVSKMADDDISVNGADSMAAMKKERKMQIAVSVDISDQSQGKAKPPEIEKLLTSSQTFARNFLQNVKGYKLEAIGTEDVNRTLKTGDDINGVTFPFLCKLKAILTSETIIGRSSDKLVYKCMVEWELIDNRTTGNGLGDNPTPVVVESMTCQNVTTRERKLLLGINQALERGDEYENAQNAYNEVIYNCMSQFYAQLANRVPFGGVVSSLKTLDDDIYVNIKADKSQGVVKKMQMMITNDDNDRIAVGEVMVSNNGKSSVKLWRWLSGSYQDKLEELAGKGKEEVEAWLDENPLYALCLGLPEQPKDMLLDARSKK